MHRELSAARKAVNQYRAMLVHGSRDEVVAIITWNYVGCKDPAVRVSYLGLGYTLVRRLSDSLFVYRLEDEDYAY